MQMLRLEKRWLETDHDCDQKGGFLLWEKFSQAQPPKIKRNEMMMIPKWGNYPGDGGGGITLVIDIWLRSRVYALPSLL